MEERGDVRSKQGDTVNDTFEPSRALMFDAKTEALFGIRRPFSHTFDG